MRDTSTAIIAQFLLYPEMVLNFPSIIRSLDKVIDESAGENYEVEWDRDDHVVFEFGNTRLIVAMSTLPGQVPVPSLTLAISPIEDKGGDLQLRAFQRAQLTELVERLDKKLKPDAVLWLEAPAPVTSDLVEAMIELLPNRIAMFNHEPPSLSDKKTISIFPSHTAPKKAEPVSKAVERFPPILDGDTGFYSADHRSSDHHILNALRHDPEYDVVPVPKSSLAMRLAAHTMNTTLILVSLPVGASLMTYSLLRGGDMAISGRVMAVTGTVMGLWDNPISHQLAAFI